MQSVVEFVTSHAGNFKAIGTIFATVLAIVKGGPKLLEAWRTFWDRRLLVKRLGAKKYTSEQILSATICYIPPDCQNIDPAGAEDWKRVYPLRVGAFQTVDKLLSEQVEFRHTILLADSGMGKTSFVLNYYVRNTRKLYPRHKIAVVPLGASDADELIKEIKDKSSTAIFLDAFDEDTKAIGDHKARLKQLLDLTADFKHVLITCRTQFFLKDDEIPREVTGLIRFGPTEGSKEYVFHKLYLSPFSETQIERYLRKQFPFWKRKDRQKARQMCRSIGDLTARPMLLANIRNLIGSGRRFEYPCQIYDELVTRWIAREHAFVPDSSALRRFSLTVARDIYINRASRGGEFIPQEDVAELALREQIDLHGWQLTGRSLLNRTANGDFKFSHRSIMEYLFVVAFIDVPHKSEVRWTDQMADFYLQYLASTDSRVSSFVLKYCDHAARSAYVQNQHVAHSSIMKHSFEEYKLPRTPSLVDLNLLAIRTGINLYPISSGVDNLAELEFSTALAFTSIDRVLYAATLAEAIKEKWGYVYVLPYSNKSNRARTQLLIFARSTSILKSTVGEQTFALPIALPTPSHAYLGALIHTGIEKQIQNRNDRLSPDSEGMLALNTLRNFHPSNIESVLLVDKSGGISQISGTLDKSKWGLAGDVYTPGYWLDSK